MKHDTPYLAPVSHAVVTFSEFRRWSDMLATAGMPNRWVDHCEDAANAAEALHINPAAALAEWRSACDDVARQVADGKLALDKAAAKVPARPDDEALTLIRDTARSHILRPAALWLREHADELIADADTHVKALAVELADLDLAGITTDLAAARAGSVAWSRGIHIVELIEATWEAVHFIRLQSEGILPTFRGPAFEPVFWRYHNPEATQPAPSPSTHPIIAMRRHITNDAQPGVVSAQQLAARLTQDDDSKWAASMAQRS